MNQCLCTNGGNFVVAAAQCIGKQSPADVAQTYTELAVNCQGSNTPLTISQAQFLAAASGSVSTTTAVQTAKVTTISGRPTTVTATLTPTPTQGPTVTVTTTPTPTDGNKSNGGDGGMGTGAKIGIAAGSVAVGVALIAALVFCCFRRRKRNSSKEESHPMLDPPASAFPGSEHSSRPSTYYDPPKYPSETKLGWTPGSGQTPPPGSSPYSATTNWATPQQAWGQPQQQQQDWAAAQQWHQPPTNYAELSPQTGAQHQNVFELASMPPQGPPSARHGAFEMPASPAVHMAMGQQGQHHPNQWHQ
jgi:hypothetical protein